jgi:outer membrane protein assembly factor BamB
MLKISRYLLVFFVVIGTVSVSIGQNEDESLNWPSFRGINARGFSDGRPTPVTWNVENGDNIEWKTPVPGLAHSSPIIWENRIFITTAVSEKKNPELKTGLYGSINPVEDDAVYQWKVYCLDKKTGKILWEKTAHKGVPKVKRHPMATHANSTAATDGFYVVAFFGSEGLYCYDLDGNLVWKKDFGVLNSAFFSVPDAQWGFASSPVIHDGVIVVQCDALNTAFLAALDIKTGKELWRTLREDYPTWSTPTIYVGERKTQVIVNGFKHIGGYDFQTGKEIWKIDGGGDIPIPTPVVAGNLVYINSAHGRMSPIYAIKLDAQGDISLKDETTANDKIVWSVRRGGSYILTPLIYGDYLYNLNWNGSLSCFFAKTGEQIYREQIGKMTSFAASGVAADGKLYFSSQEGDVYVIKSGPNFEILATNSMKDENLATPAISEGKLYFRTHHYLFAIAEK